MARVVNIGPLTVELRRRHQNVGPIARDPQRALDVLRAPELAGDGRAPSPKLAAYLDEARRSREATTTLDDLVGSLPWYHTIELPGGVVTKGAHDHRAVVPRIGLPDSLAGLRALDVATYDGFWAFELEKRGAEVVAIDLPRVSSLDWPPAVAEIVANEGLDIPLGETFRVAAEALGSSVQRVERSVYQLDPEVDGKFELVHSGDLLLHLAAPVVALQRMRSVCGGRAIIVDRYDPSLSGQVVAYRGGWSSLEWWAPSLATLLQWVSDAGFVDVELRDTYQLPTRFSSEPGWARAVIHARVA